MSAPGLSRRSLLRAAGVLAATAYAGAGCSLSTPSQGGADPFALGVASGDPTPDGVVLWTRLAPKPYEPEALGQADLPVEWEVAEDDGMRTVVQRGVAAAEAAWAHSVHVEVAGLRADRRYWYRFRSGDVLSPAGRTRTLPAAGAPVARWRLACASCAHYEQGYFNAYRAIAEDDVDLVFHVGDYIYERPQHKGRVRQHRGGESVTLADYRNRYAQYRLDADLQAAHAAHPWVVTWDDHEVENDYAADHGEHNEPVAEFHRRRAAAYQAYYEHMPLRAASRPRDGAAQIYRAFAVGDLAAFHVLDTRQYRDDQPCPGPGWGGQLISRCPERLDPRRTMLGAEQERWLSAGLGRMGTRWNTVVQQLLIAQLKRPHGPLVQYWSDGWDGYPAARARLLGEIRDRRVPNVVTLGGDIHSFWVTDLKPDFDDDSAPVATEFVGTSITSLAGNPERLRELARANPHVRFMESRWRGYLRADIAPERWRTDWRVVDDVKRRGVAARTLASYGVESGRPGASLA